MALTTPARYGLKLRHSYKSGLHSILGGLVLLGPLSCAVFAQDAQQITGCILTKGAYVCSRVAFQKALMDARTVGIDVRSMDRNGRAQLEQLAGELGKTVAGPQQTTDLTFALVQIDPNGVNIGPSGRELATLSVYAAGADGRHGPLVWSETFTGQPDMRWSAVVHALILQFRSQFANR